MWILLIGNPIEGFTVMGTFGSAADATYYGDHHMEQNIEWWVMEVHPAVWVPSINSGSEDTKPRSGSMNSPLDVNKLEYYIRTGEEKHD